jgi:two-component system, NtrC family, sensor kinase
LAMDYLKKSVPYFINDLDYKHLGETYYDIAKVFEAQNLKDSSMYYARKAFNLSQASESYESINVSALLISSLLEKTDTKQSFEYYKIAVAAKDSVFNLQKNIQLQNIDFQEKVRQQELLDSKKDFENKQKFGLLLGLLAAFLVISLIQFRNNKHKQKANVTLQMQKDEIESQKVALQSTVETLKTTQNQLIQQEKLASLGELTAGIAHEIQNPLNFVNNFSEVSGELIKELQDERIKNKEERDEQLENELLDDLANNQVKIHHHGSRASSIVKAMLDHSRNSTGQRTMVDLNLISEEYLRLSYLGLRAKYKDFNADFEFFPDKNLPKIEVVSQDIGRVILNLINNAFYAVYDRKNKLKESNYLPKVKVFATWYPDVKLNDKIGVVEIRVEDNGIGINNEIKGKIFQPFFTTKPTGEGTGLGLSLSYDIITKGHLGLLKVESELNVGTTFIIQLHA